MLSTLITVTIVLVVVGFVLWLINRFIPMMGPIKTLLNIVVVVALIIWVLSIFGVINLQQIHNYIPNLK